MLLPITFINFSEFFSPLNIKSEDYQKLIPTNQNKYSKIKKRGADDASF